MAWATAVAVPAMAVAVWFGVGIGVHVAGGVGGSSPTMPVGRAKRSFTTITAVSSCSESIPRIGVANGWV